MQQSNIEDIAQRTCSQCGKIYSDKGCLRKHFKTKHSEHIVIKPLRSAEETKSRKKRHCVANKKYIDKKRKKYILPAVEHLRNQNFIIDSLITVINRLIKKIKHDLEHGPLTTIAKNKSAERIAAIKYGIDLTKEFKVSRIPFPNINWQDLLDKANLFCLDNPIDIDCVDDFLSKVPNPRSQPNDDSDDDERDHFLNK